MKMRKQKKGFTITELVIVIAVIAVLAAVLIPTFVSLVRRANESKDIQLVHNLNTALTIDGEEHHTMQDALDAALESGYDVDKINASATGNEILWDKVNDQFCYLKKDGNTKTIEYIPDSVREDEAKGADFWQICDKMPDTQEYSIYAGNKWTGPAAITNLTVGFDVGTNDDITSIEYIRTAADATAQTVTIRTNSTATTLTINAPLDTVYHYGDAGDVNVIAVDKLNSYHENGTVSGTLDVAIGHVVVETTGKVEKINVSATVADAFSVEDKSNTVAMVTADTPSVLTETNVKVSNKNSVMTSENANAVAYSANNGFIADLDALKTALTGNNTITLLKDINMEANYSLANGTLDLNGHKFTSNSTSCTIKILKNEKLTIKDSSVDQSGIISNTLIGKNINTILVSYGATLNLLGGTINSGIQEIGETYSSYGIMCYDETNILIDGGNIKGFGCGVALWNSDSLKLVSGSIISTGWFCVANNGSIDKPSKFIMEGGELIGHNEFPAIYQSGPSSYLITGGLIKAGTPIEIRNGSLTITGGKFVSTASEFTCKPNGNGSTTKGAALAIAQHTTKGDITINISGGEFEGYVAIAERNPQGNSEADLSKISITITGGSFKAINGGTNAIDLEDFSSTGFTGYTVSGNVVSKEANN